MKRPLCIWHGNCIDGFTSAWAVNKYFKGEVDFHAGVYGEPVPVEKAKDREVLVVDFSYKHNAMQDLIGAAKSVLVLDHHKTAHDELKPWLVGNEVKGLPRIGCWAVFDMNRSGAGLTWDYLFGGGNRRRPEIVNSVEDRDLWRFKLVHTREIHAALSSYPFDFKVWDELAEKLESDYRRQFVVAEGMAIDRKHLQVCKDVIEAGKHYADISGYTVPVCNATFNLASDIGNIMCKGEPFAATYYDKADGKRVYSLRAEGKVDVSDVAKGYGGGGHANAAGFTVRSEDEL